MPTQDGWPLLPLFASTAVAQQLPPGSAWKDPAWGDPPDRAFRRHRVIGHEHAPDVDVWVASAEHDGGGCRFRTNNLGLRRDGYTSLEKAPGVFRVLVLGDAQADGYVENWESLASALEASLGDQLGATSRRVEVLNAAIAGYSPSQEFLWYSAHGVELRPDLVIVLFYPGNDVLDALDPTKPDVDLATGRAVRPQDDGPAGTVGGADLSGAGGYSTETLVEVLRTCHGCYLQGLQQAARARQDPLAMQRAAGRAGTILTLLDGEVRINGGSLLVAALPTRAQIEPLLAPPLQYVVAGLLGLDEADLRYEDEVSRAVLSQVAAAGIPTLDLREPLDAVAWDGPLYYSRDWHLNARGHWAVGAALAWGLAGLGLLPS